MRTTYRTGLSVLLASSLLAGITALGSGLRTYLAQVDVVMLYLAAVVLVSSWSA